MFFIYLRTHSDSQKPLDATPQPWVDWPTRNIIGQSCTT